MDRQIFNLIKEKTGIHIARKGGFYYSNELWFSDAYQTLTKSARNLLHCLINELHWTGRGIDKKYTDNGTRSFTEIHFKKLHHYCSATYLKSRNQLIENGLIKQTYRGGMCKGDRATYRILCTPEVQPKHQRWRRYPNQNWADEIPKRKKQLVGKSTQWKKGKSGRNIKPTLQKYTLKRPNDPIELYSR